MACGNGLRSDIWNEFKTRFRVPAILEFYAATEGNVSFFNIEERPGAVGRIPRFLAHRFPASLIRVDTETGEPLRIHDGLCVRCTANEVGEAIGPLDQDPSNIGGRFEGYTTEEASERKIIRNVFNRGDSWFRTGDLMRGRTRLLLLRRPHW
jgi:fatty-acyl-CoA synthase